MDIKEKIQRSVDSLETIYAVVIAFAVTKAIETVLFDPANKTVEFGRLIEHGPGLLAFFVTIVPFYHGMHRHLSRTYIEETASSKREGFLLLDFFIFFLEACILLVFASSLDSGGKAFIALGALLVVDSVWAIVAHGIHYSDWKNSPWKWSAINIVTIVLLYACLFSNVFDEGMKRVWALTIIAISRTIADYAFCWPFYFPRENAGK
jgi:hypothetical protein